MALRIDSSQNRNLYVGTGTEVAVNDSNAIISGNVGIGTTTPSNLLSLKGSGQNWNTSPAIKLWDSAYSKGWYVGTANNATSGDFYIRSVTSEAAYPVAADQQFTIKQGGNVGIGTISPAAKLEITGTTEGRYLQVDAIAGFAGLPSGMGAMVEFFNAGDGNNVKIQTSNSVRTDAAPFSVWTDANSRFIIRNDGKVGIGTTSPSQKLDVQGNVNISGTIVEEGSGNNKTYRYRTPNSNSYTGGNALITFGRLYWTPAHWVSDGPVLEVTLQCKYYSGYQRKYIIKAAYQNDEVIVNELQPSDTEQKITLQVGTKTAAGYDYAGQPVYYADLQWTQVPYIWGWAQLSAQVPFLTSNPTSGWGGVVVYSALSQNNNAGTPTDHASFFAGKVGIGTTNTTNGKLNVNGNLSLDTNPEIQYSYTSGGPYLNVRSRDSATSACGVKIHSPYGSPGYFYGEGSGSGSSSYIGVLDGGGNWGLQIRTGTSTSLWTNGSNRLHIDSGGNVMIGTTTPAPSAQLTIALNDSVGGRLALSNLRTALFDSDEFGRISFVSNDTDQTGDRARISAVCRNTGAATDLVFYTGNTSASVSDRMRITSTGDVLIGKTSNTIATAGAKIGATTGTNITRDSNEVLYLNRTTNFGKTLSIGKDGTTIGEIGTYGGVPYIGYSQGAGGGIMFNGLSIEPTGIGSSRSSNTNDVGSPNYKWRNGYFGNAVSAATYTAAAAEGLRINDSAAYISGYNTAGTQRTGYIQFLHASGTILIDSELGSRYTVMALASASAVGIGTSLPDEKLTVNGITRAVDPIYFGAINTDNGTYGPYIESSDNKGLKFDYNGNTGGEFQVWNHDVNGGAASQVFNIDQDGNVGINITSGSDKLTLKGAFSLYDTSAISTVIRLNPNGDSYINGGDLGVGITLPQHKLDVGGAVRSYNYRLAGNTTNPTTTAATIYDQASVGLTLSAHNVELRNYNGSAMARSVFFTHNTATFTGTCTATNFILSSDKTLKENVKDIDTKHIDVNWKNFELKSEPGVKRSGVIAQELEKKHPEFVRTNEDGLKSVAYIDLLIAKIAELEARLEKAGL